MKTEQRHWKSTTGWGTTTHTPLQSTAQLVIAFGSREVLTDNTRFEELRAMYPNAHLVMGSTAGEIIDIEVHDNTLVATAIEFERATLAVAQTGITEGVDSEQAGIILAQQLLKSDLKYVFVLSDGLAVNGSELVNGFYQILPPNVVMTGGLAGDAALFQQTLVGLNSPPQPNTIVAFGLYGEGVQLGFASIGGWEAFGAERLVTKSDGNILYELDGKPALELYKTYLGEKVSGLPATALLFPLSLENKDAANNLLVRTILSIDEEMQSMTFAGDIPQGSKVRLMKANFERLVDGAEQATELSLATLKSEATLAILVSCVGRKLVMAQRIEDELEVVRTVVGDTTTITGFYSYGELAPSKEFKPCLLHNQTMTVTLMSEKI